MAPKKKPWFRLYTETIHDRKLRRLPPAHRWLWVVVLAVARQSPEPGLLLVDVDDPIVHDDLVDAAALKPKEVRDGMGALVRAGMVDVDEGAGAWRVVNWADRQHESDTSAERTRRYRQRHKDTQGDGDVTSQPPSPRRPSSRAPATESEAETEKDPPAGDAKPSRGKPRSDRAQRLPDGWHPDPEPELVKAVGGQRRAAEEFAKFCDYWRAKAGKDGRKLDWQATWRNWLRRAAEDRGGKGREPPPAAPVRDYDPDDREATFRALTGGEQ